jgi:hypothetical protein
MENIENNIIITDRHRTVYSNIYRKRKKYTYLGYHVNNVISSILDDLVKLGYLELSYSKTSNRKYENGFNTVDIYRYFKITGKKLPRKKHATKKLKKLYNIDNVEFILTPAEEPKATRSGWEYTQIRINDITYDIMVHFADKNINFFFKYEDGRWYKFSYNSIVIGGELWQCEKIKWDRMNKIKDILSE